MSSEAAEPELRPQPRQPQEQHGSAKKQAAAWFADFLREAESEVKAAQDAKAARAAAPPAQLLIEDYDQEREMWEARIRALEQGRGCGVPTQEEVSSASVKDNASPSCASRAASNERSGQVADADGSLRLEGKEVAAEEAGLEAANADEGSQIAAALREAGLEPGVAAAHALAAAAQAAAGDADIASFGDGDDGDGSRNGSGVAAQWAMPARQWAAERLRRKREKARSRIGTPCGSNAGTPSNNTAHGSRPLFSASDAIGDRSQGRSEAAGAASRSASPSPAPASPVP